MLFFLNNVVPNYPMYIYFKRINRAIEFVIVDVKSIKCCISELGYCRIIVRSKEINNELSTGFDGDVKIIAKPSSFMLTKVMLHFILELKPLNH